jgi:two-component system response regulator MprA
LFARRVARGVIRPLLRIGERWYAALDSQIPEHVPSPEAGEGVLAFGDLVLNLKTREVFRGRRPIDLTRTEFRLLELFLRNPRQVLTREVIFDRVWGFDFGPRSNTLSVYIGYLRRKIEAGGEARIIHTVRGVGYMLRE